MANRNEPQKDEAKPVPAPIYDAMAEKGYTILKQIGKGAYSSVHIATYQPKNSQKRVILACKIIDTRKVPNLFVKIFLPREINIMQKIKHPNIIAIHSIFALDTTYLLFMTYAPKGDILSFVQTNGALKEQQAFTWFRQVTNAVNYLHDLGIAHRDLKCENLLLSNRYHVKLSDFGFSRFVRDDKGAIIKSQTYCGSMAYAPPELITGTPYDPIMSDSWSLGVILFVMLNKAMPFDDSNVKRIVEYQREQNWHFRSQVSNFLSDDVKYVVFRLLQPKLDQRWTTKQVLESPWFKKNNMISPLEVSEVEEELEDQEEPKDTEDSTN